MADVDSESEGETGPHPSVPSTNPLPRTSGASTNLSNPNPIDPDEITSDHDTIPPRRNKNDNVVSIRGWDKKPSHQGQRLPEIAPAKIPKVGVLEHNDTEPSAWKQLVIFQLTPFRLEWLIDSDIPRPPEEDVSAEKWYYWSRLVASWMYFQIDKTLQSKLGTLPEIPKYADSMCDELMSLTEGGDRVQTALIELKKFDTMKRSDYNSASDYIEAYRRQYYVLARFKTAPHPLHALSQVLRNLDVEVKKVQFIREEVANLEPKKLSLAKVEEYWKGLQAAADMEDVTNPAVNAGRGGRGNGRGGRGGNPGGRGGYNSGHHNNDNTITTAKKKKKGFRKQPADGKDIHEYTQEMRNGAQKDDNNMCSFCGFGPHPAKRCAFLSGHPPASWEPSGNLWAYSKAILRAQRQEGQNNMF